MEYYYNMPPQNADAVQYQQYQYVAGPQHPASHNITARAAVGRHPNTAFLPPGRGDRGGHAEAARYPSTSNYSNSFGGEDGRGGEGKGGGQPIRNNCDDAPTRTVYKKAPGAPKRFKSSYVHFFTHYIDQKKNELGPDGEPIKMDVAAVSKECSQIWKSMSPEQKQHWDQLSEMEKRGYNEQKAAYQGPWRIATKKVKKKKVGVPKRAPSAFFLFVNANRPILKERYPDMQNQTVVKTCSDMWKELSESEKGRYLEEEKRLRAQYYIDAENWKRGARDETLCENAEDVSDEATNRKFPPAESMTPPESASSKQKLNGATFHHGKKRKSDRRDPNAPKRSPPAFFLFVNHCRPALKNEFPELKHTELVKMLSQKWAEMSEEAKKPFRDHEEQLRQQYHIDIAHYRKGAIPESEYDLLDSL